jgi:hypothetical protein
MSLTRIDPADFVFNNDDLSVSCWRDENGNPVGTPSSIPSWGEQVIEYEVNNSIGFVTNYYIGDNPANIQWSRTGANKNGDSYQQAVYGAIRNIVVGDANADITWGGAARSGFSVISISKNIPLPLLPGSIRVGNLTDDSNITSPRILNCGRAYDLKPAPFVNGNYILGYGAGSSLGLFLPDVGLILAAAASTNFALCTLNPTPTNHVFIRARNTQYNYSMNPSFISGSSGYIINQDWFDNPQTYITTVGLYNDNNELMATAKLPRPYNKNFNNELLMQIGLNF